jgi:hypothetical protein
VPNKFKFTVKKISVAIPKQIDTVKHMDSKDNPRYNGSASAPEQARQFNYLFRRIFGPEHDEEAKLTDEQSREKYEALYPESL